MAFRSPTPLSATTTSKLSFRVIAAFVTAASSQPSHTVFRECGWYLERERRSFTARRSTDGAELSPASLAIPCSMSSAHHRIIHPSLRNFSKFPRPAHLPNDVGSSREKPMIGVGIPPLREANDEVLQGRTLRARAGDRKIGPGKPQMSASEPGVELRHRWRVDVSCVACRKKGRSP